MIERLQALLYAEEILLSSTNERLNVVTRNFLDLSNKMPNGEFYQAIMLGEEGSFQMRPGYKGYFAQVVRMLEGSRQNLLVQKQECIVRIKHYQDKIKQLLKRSNVLGQTSQVTNTMRTSPTINMGQTSMPTSDTNVDQNENNMNIGRTR